MRVRTFVKHDLARLTALTIDTFRPFYEDHFRPTVGDAVFANQHGDWRGDYRTQVAGLHDPSQHKHVAVAETDDVIAGYVAWTVDPARRNGSITILAVAAGHRRQHAGLALCEHAFEQMRAHGAEVVEIGTGADPFHAPARALYEKLGCVPIPVRLLLPAALALPLRNGMSTPVPEHPAPDAVVGQTVTEFRPSACGVLGHRAGQFPASPESRSLTRPARQPRRAAEHGCRATAWT
jgi:ribosomal protein S18 acetylase RimI-like enzyme